MMLKSVFLCILIVVAVITLCGGQISYAASAPTDQDLDEDSEVITEDHRHEFTPTVLPKVGKHVVPHLGQLRAQHAQETGLQALPVPSGVGSGTLYQQNQLRASSQAVLRTGMIVHPEGIPTLPDNWLFTTATNRTEKTVEVVGIYFGTDLESLGIFDWSCLPDDPCPNGMTGPSWQWTKPLAPNLACYVAEGTGGDGQRYAFLYYSNESQRMGHANPPQWRNTVKLWNVCGKKGRWDIVYTHDFRVQQEDCSVSSFSCGWWGPIIETFFTDPQPLISRLGFQGSTLTHDRVTSTLPSTETDFVTPAYPWQTYYLHPNDSWIVGP